MIITRYEGRLYKMSDPPPPKPPKPRDHFPEQIATVCTVLLISIIGMMAGNWILAIPFLTLIGGCFFLADIVLPLQVLYCKIKGKKY